MAMIGTVTWAGVLLQEDVVLVIPDVLYVEWFIRLATVRRQAKQRFFVGGLIATKDSGIADELIALATPGQNRNDILHVKYNLTAEEGTATRAFARTFYGGNLGSDGEAKMTTLTKKVDSGTPSLHLIPFMCGTEFFRLLPEITLEVQPPAKIAALAP